MHQALSVQLLEYFVTIVQEGSITRAARRLHMAEASLSKDVQKMEREYRTTLFLRTKHGSYPTREGRILYREAIETIKHFRRARALMLFRARAKKETFHVGHSPFIHAALPSLLQQLDLPKKQSLKIMYEASLTAGVVDRVLAGSVDIGFGVLPVADPDLVVRQIVHEPFVVAMPEAYPRLKDLRVMSSRDLNGEALVWVPRRLHPRYCDPIMKYFHDLGVSFSAVHEVLSPVQAMEFARSSLGMALLGRSNAMIKREGVMFRPLSDTLIGVDTGFFYRRDNEHPLLQPFIERTLNQVAAAKLGQ